ncbi:MAG: hypothetical protein AAB309_03655 [Deltaproteobacteria bacterium]
MKPCSFTGVGSLPHRSPKSAVSHVFKHYEIPFLPQLPNGGMEKGMRYADFSCHGKKTNLDLQRKVDDFFSYASLDDFLNEYDRQKVLKIQMIGPYTVGRLLLCRDRLTVIDHKDIHPHFLQIYIKKAVEFLSLFEAKNKMWIIFDEPFLNELSAGEIFSGLDRIILKIEKKVDGSKFLFGLHSCNRWTPSLFSQFYDTRLRLMSFDVELGGNAIFENRQKLFEYLKKGFLLWGIVPTQKIYRTMKGDYFLRYLQTKNLQKKEVLNILSRSHFTPACGTATLRLKDEQTIARRLREISVETRRYYERGS